MSVGHLEDRLPERDLFHVGATLANCDRQDGHFKCYPPRMFNSTPWVRNGNAIYRLGPIEAAERMIYENDHRRSYEHSPIPVEGHERQRAKHVEMCLCPSAAQVNEQTRHEHLRHCDNVSRHRCARNVKGQENREGCDQATYEESSGHIDGCVGGFSLSSEGSQPKNAPNAGDPLD